MIHLVIPDPHAHYKYHNDRADHIGRLILDLRPDVVICMGDSADMPSLCSYDHGKKSFQGRTYRADVDAHLEFQERLWAPVKAAKKKKPHSVFLEGNHEHRIKRAIEIQPELDGAISFNDLLLHRWYDNVVEYSGSVPGVTKLDGVYYAHFFVSGVALRPIGGQHHEYSLLAIQHASCTAAHSHLAGWTSRVEPDGTRIHGLVAGCALDYDAEWSGVGNRLWWRGVVICRSVQDGDYEPQFVTLKTLEKEYGSA